MVEDSYKIIKYINEGKTCNEICDLLNISNKALYNRLNMLKKAGYYFDRNYFYDGNIIYTLTNPFDINPKNIIINPGSELEEINLVLISDTHLGSLKDNIKSLDELYNFCIKNNYNIILHAGDFFDGIYNDIKEYKVQGIDQINYGLNNYPFDKNILTFLCLGNHDSTFFLEKGIDIKKVIEQRRDDIIPLGHGYGKIMIDNIEIIMKHAIDRIGLHYPKLSTDHIIIKGHSHKYKITNSHNLFTISVPSLSSIKINGALEYPSFLTLNLKASENYIESAHIEQYIYLEDNYVRASETNYNLGLTINTSYDDNLRFSKIIEPKVPDYIRELKK